MLYTTKELLALRTKAEAFAKDNLIACCEEMIEWQETGILPDGKLRELATLFNYTGYTSLAVAEAEIRWLALKVVVFHGK